MRSVLPESYYDFLKYYICIIYIKIYRHRYNLHNNLIWISKNKIIFFCRQWLEIFFTLILMLYHVRSNNILVYVHNIRFMWFRQFEDVTIWSGHVYVYLNIIVYVYRFSLKAYLFSKIWTHQQRCTYIIIHVRT